MALVARYRERLNELQHDDVGRQWGGLRFEAALDVLAGESGPRLIADLLDAARRLP